MAQGNTGPRLELRQSQQLVMTAQLQQSIKLLQMGSAELIEFLETEIERNPLLMLEESDEAKDRAAREDVTQDDSTSQEGASAGAGESDFAGENASSFDGPGDFSSTSSDSTAGDQASDWLDAQDQDFWNGENEGGDSNPWDGGEAYMSSGSRGLGDEDTDAGSILEQTLKSEVSLQAHLFEQLQQAMHDPADRVIGARLIEHLDESGYLHADLEDIATELGGTEREVERVLLLLQGFEPTGVFARSLSECLALQLRERDRLDPAMQSLLDHLELLGAGKLDTLRKKCGVDGEDLAEMISEIKSLNPKPGLGFARDESQTVIPDVLLRRGSMGQWIVELNAQVLPRLIVNRRYLAQLQTGMQSQSRGIGHNSGQKEQMKHDKKYLTEAMATASWLVKALDQRAQSLLKVATEIVSQQDGFFRHGVAHLKPMTLKDIANVVGVHESTVSRVTNNKYIGTNRGLFELKYFFTSALSSDEGDGGDVSSKAVQHYIREMIDAEKPDKILSDDTIAEMLQARGINVARRTVAKYRDLMKIGSSSERRRAKKIAG